MSREIRVAVVGATGAVGETLLSILEERSFPVEKIFPLASKRSTGSTVMFRGRPVLIQELDQFDFNEVELAFFMVSSELAEKFVPRAVKAGCIVIDNSLAFRHDPDVPLVIPEVNRGAISQFTKKHIVANPNCSTIQLLVALKPIYDLVGISRINVATYQSVSGAGQEGISELANQTASLLNGRKHDAEVFPKTIAFNTIPHIDPFEENGYTKEELKLHYETQKILQDTEISVNATCVRVPVFYGHSEVVHFETRKKLTLEMARELLSKAPGVVLVDDPKQNSYPTPVDEAAGEDGVFVGRLREDISHPLGFNLWIVADAVRKGGALNAVQIAEILVREYL
jgi:aspartate-semialdehyde dehydrogenase